MDTDQHVRHFVDRQVRSISFERKSEGRQAEGIEVAERGTSSTKGLLQHKKTTSQYEPPVSEGMKRNRAGKDFGDFPPSVSADRRFVFPLISGRPVTAAFAK